MPCPPWSTSGPRAGRAPGALAAGRAFFHPVARAPRSTSSRAWLISSSGCKAHGVPDTVHRPSLYLSLPGAGRKRRKRFRAKPPAFSFSGAERVFGPARLRVGEATDGIDNVFDMKLEKGATIPGLAGKIVITEGFASPGHVSQFEAVGRRRPHRHQSRRGIHWGICTTDLGHARPRRSAAQPDDPGPRGQQPRRRGADRAGQDGRPGRRRHRARGRLVRADPGGRDPGRAEPEEFVLLHGHSTPGTSGSATTRPATRRCWRSPASVAAPRQLERSLRIAWWSGHSPAATPARPGSPTPSRIDLAENCVAQVNCDSPGCRWATEFNELTAMSETEPFVERVIRESPGITPQGERPPRAGDYSFNNIGLPAFYMLSLDDVAGEAGGEGLLRGRRLRRQHRLAHRGRHARDRRPRQPAARHQGLSARGAAHRQCRILPFDWRRAALEFVETIGPLPGKAGSAFRAWRRRGPRPTAARLSRMERF